MVISEELATGFPKNKESENEEKKIDLIGGEQGVVAVALPEPWLGTNGNGAPLLEKSIFF